ncbi:MAG: D-alanyl-D-alanine carboxypeptidase [Firmicutes bacterium]|nr:D-alanyl-D-alanine carboxypeptidase [Bacillota bacterium]
MARRGFQKTAMAVIVIAAILKLSFAGGPVNSIPPGTNSSNTSLELAAPPGPSQVGQIIFDIPSESAILTEASSGQVLWQKNAHKRLPPASISKIMTLLLAMEAVQTGRVSLDDQVTVSATASRQGGSEVFLAQGERFPLRDLLKAIAIASANDASVAVAEYLAGTEQAFVTSMNRRAKELGMKDTYFFDSSGLPAPEGVQGNYTTAYDVAIMSRELVKYPQILKWTSTWQDSLRGGKFVLTNTNRLLNTYLGADGLKTGHTEEAGWSLSATSIRNGLRLIAVVLRTESDEARVEQAAHLMDYGFRAFARVPVASRGRRVGTVAVPNGTRTVLPVETGQPLVVLTRRGDESLVQKKLVLPRNVQAPLSKGQKVGELRATLGNETLGRVDLVAAEPVARANPVVVFFRRIWGALVYIVTLGRG